ncbi:type II toxin-antitoxin system VapC family toxin [uncultured Rhodoblastus sp.]|uniref:type II toxin-antitoxin system VapC family toxin n=1 Tax=uncultured Rhodoblastus sp. TaxID=543037 RepID=UPI0025D90903|nr:type II toxin-antitoxin system VapC family toxin [uncultured Rhodoblastus sp.]
MIAVDTSALMAILKREPEGNVCSQALANAGRVLISAGTVAEALIVAGGRANIAAEMLSLFYLFDWEIVSVTSDSAHRVAEAYAKWGKGVHSAGLNFGDCFAYEVAKTNDCPLLFVGNDFSQTDVTAAI